MKARVKKILNKVYKNIMRPEMKILPGQISFFMVLSIIPLAALIVALASEFSLSITSFINSFLDNIPKEAADIIKNVIQGEGLNFNMTVFYISTLILASNGTYSMILASNTMYKFENKSYLRRRFKALVMTVILVLLILFIILVPAFGDLIFKVIEYFVGQTSVTEYAYKIYRVLKYPLSIVFIFISVKLLYTMAPDTRIKSKTTTRGSIFTTIFWILATDLYSFYIRHFTRYNLFYGSVANIIVLLLWVYLLSYIFVLGMALNETEHGEIERTRELNLKEIKDTKK